VAILRVLVWLITTPPTLHRLPPTFIMECNKHGHSIFGMLQLIPAKKTRKKQIIIECRTISAACHPLSSYVGGDD